MLIEAWSDVVCPWCYVGKRRLEAAVAQSGIEAQVVHRAFQLDPAALTQGQLTGDMLRTRYGVSADQAAAMQRRVSEVAAGVGLAFRLDATVVGNTLDAHRLVLWAQQQGLGQELLAGLFHRYFELAEAVFTADELVPVAAAVGLDAGAAREFLAGDSLAADVAADQRQAAAYGATGVPFVVFDRSVGVSGAQPAEVFAAAILQAGESGVPLPQ